MNLLYLSLLKLWNRFKVDIKKYIIKQLSSRYWRIGEEHIYQLPIPTTEIPRQIKFPNMVNVTMPGWAAEFSVKGSLLIPEWAIDTNISENEQWKHIDWFSICFWYLNALPEREFENRFGPIHSYSFKLTGWNHNIWEYAWVNRIALFLRKWAVLYFDLEEKLAFSPLPEYKLHITHDVDAVQKTFAIRLKQTSFNIFNSMKCLLNLDVRGFLFKLQQAGRFAFSREDYWFFDYIIATEKKQNIKSYFNFYAGEIGKNRTWKEAFFDPGYEIKNIKILNILSQLHGLGHIIGLHQSFNTWNNKQLMREQKKRLEEACKLPITTCRQHWLRFSWQDTWKIQYELGFENDMTLGFNDRPSFRSSAALHFNPWDSNNQKILNLNILPTIFMDSHFYDYQKLSQKEIKISIAKWINEVKLVHGEAAIIWHQQVMGKDYGWSDGFECLLENL